MAEVSQIRVRGTLYDIKDTVARRGSGSSPAVASTAAGMTDTSKIYVYTGSETGYTAGNWYYYDGTSWVSGGIYQSSGIETDTTLAVSGAAADSKATGDAINNIVYVGSEVQDSHTQMLVSPTTSELEIVTKTEFDTELSELKSQISSKSGLSEEIKTTLMAVVEHIGAWTDGNGRTYVENFRSALFPPANLTRITAVYTQGGTVYDTDSLDSLKENLVVTAYYDDESSEVVSAYVLSGTLTEGTSTITVTYGGKSATFDVTVTHYEQWDINWSYTDGLPENNGFTLLSTNASAKTLREDGLLLANTGSTGNISYGVTNEPVPCKRLIFESVFSPQTLATLPSTPKGCGYYVLFVNNGKGINVAVNSGGLGYYEGKDTATKGWHFADVSIATETEYTVRLEVDDTSDTATLYLDGSLITTFGIASTTSAQTKIYQLNGGSTLHKSMKLRYEQ